MFLSHEELTASAGWQLGRELLGLRSRETPNASVPLLDRNVNRHPQKVALIARDYEGSRRSLSFTELMEQSVRFASVLDALSIRLGDRVATLLEPGPELYAAVLGIVRTGAMVQPLFPGFGYEAIADRLSDAGTSVLVTNARHLSRVRQAIGRCAHPIRVLVIGEAELETGEELVAELMRAAAPQRPASPVTAETALALHYSSGTTGKPKGAVLTHEALIGQAATTAVVLDLKPDDHYWCTADPGWVTGTAYGIFGPWALGATQISYAGGFSAEAWYEVIAQEKVTVWYTSPTALRMLMREGTDVAREYDLTSLRHICSVGEPLNPRVIEWGQETYGLTIHDTWWQTETGCIQIANYPFMEVRPGSMGRPFAGVAAGVLDQASGNLLPPGQEGALVLRPPWPSMFRTYWQQPDLYQSKIVGDWYITGDRAYQDSDGYFWFVSRDDDVINTSGHLVGPFEVESALLKHTAIAESVVFGVPDEALGVAIVARVVPVSGVTGSKSLIRELQTLVRREVGVHAVPRVILISDQLPRTRSGKLMRRVARAEYLGLPLGDTSALE